MKEKFIQFLKDNGAFEKFEANLKDTSCKFAKGDPDTIDKLTEDCDDTCLISSAFWWPNSPEGIKYWTKINNKWTKLCR